MAGRLISVEAFAQDRQELADQANAITALAYREREWLQYARPQTFDNFQSAEITMSSMRRVITAETVDGYVARDAATERALAIGTVVSNLTIHDPRHNWFQTLTGDQIDYWAALEVNDEEHIDIAGRLLAATKTPQVLAILTEEQEERAGGILSMMLRAGPPAPIRVPLWVRRGYELRSLHEPVQVFTVDRSRR